MNIYVNWVLTKYSGNYTEKVAHFEQPFCIQGQELIIRQKSLLISALTFRRASSWQ